MNEEERFAPVFESWLRDTEVPAPDAGDSIRQVKTRLPQTRQLGRWRWLPPLRTNAGARPTIDQTIDYQPSPIPATNGHSPTVLGRTQSMFSPVKAITAGVVVFALGGVLFIAQPFDQQGQSVPGAATDGAGLESASVTGTLTGTEGLEQRGMIADEVWREQLDESGRMEMSDSRLTGDFSGAVGINRYQPVEVYADYFEGLAETRSGTVTIENDGGTWVGTLLGVSGTDQSETYIPDSSIYQLTGTGAYEGLSALLFHEVDGDGVYGVIVPGALLPEVPVDALSEW